MSNITYERRKAVDLAWKNEKGRVLDGKGTRDWSQKEQREIIARGKAKGYQGHHMKSVDGHNSKAGEPDNIQFLTRREHLNAHKGNYRNNTNGYYDPKSQKMNEFGRNKASVESKALSQPLSKSQKQYATKKAEAIKFEKNAKARERAATKKLNINKSKSSTTSRVNSRSVQSKTLSNQRASTSRNSRSCVKGHEKINSGGNNMANAQNSKSFRDSLKVKNVDHSKAQAASKAKAKSSSSGGPGQKGNQGRTKGGMTR